MVQHGVPVAQGSALQRGPVQADATREGTSNIVAGTKQNDLAVSFGLSYKTEWTPAAPP